MSSPALVRVGVLVVLVIAGAVALYIWGLGRQDDEPPSSAPKELAQEAPDPRLTFDTPFRNVRPDVAFVGDAACAPCHKDLCDSYHQHPMGRSAALWSAVSRIEKFGDTAKSSFDGVAGAHFRISEKDGHLRQSEERLGPDGQPIVSTAVDAAIVIGSGHQARSYVCIRDGSLWQTGVSWFTARQRWDMSPGFGPGQHAQRPVTEMCLFCHVDRVDRVAGAESRYREPLFAHQANIGCERCHGPGSLHVAERTDGIKLSGLDSSIVNPRHLSPSLRDAVCQQCHLQGEQQVVRRGRGPFDYRPGLPLELFISVVVKTAPPGQEPQFVGHVEQMAASKCAAGSAGKLSCTSCHDPHRDPPPATRAAHYRQACQKCHADRPCTLPIVERQAKNDSCVECHMPRKATADVSHTAVTDHRILRHAGAIAPAPVGPTPELPIRLYHDASKVGLDPDERDRDLGIALAYLVRLNKARGVGDPVALEHAIGLLGRTTKRFPADAIAWESYAVVLSADGQTAESLAAAEKSIAVGPAREPALHHAIMTALRLKDVDKARGYARTAVEINPGNPLSRMMLGLVLTEAHEWKEGAEVLRGALRDMPGHPDGRAALAVCLFHTGDRLGSQTEVDRLTALMPDQANNWRDWVRRRTVK